MTAKTKRMCMVCKATRHKETEMQLRRRRDSLPQWQCATCGHCEPAVSSPGAADSHECPQCRVAMDVLEVGLILQKNRCQRCGLILDLPRCEAVQLLNDARQSSFTEVC